MNKVELFKSITGELKSLKNRVRNFIGDAHWLSDGEWKESVLKSIIKRHIPTNIGVGSGFIVNEIGCSSQIDIILYDLNVPILFRDGDFIIITPDSVKGIIEVKTTVEYISDFVTDANKLYENVLFVRNSGNLEYLFIGLFAYETKILPTGSNLDNLLTTLSNNSNVSGYISNINHISLGNDLFVKFWDEDPICNDKVYNTWHIYDLTEQAPAYFIMNSVIEVSHNRNEIDSYLWFPPDGKERQIIAKKKLQLNT
mgnify:CR=1 FL=1